MPEKPNGTVGPIEEWPIDREFVQIESKLAPYDDYGDWQRRIGEERDERLGDRGQRLQSEISEVSRLMNRYDMTIDEALKVLEYLLDEYRTEAEDRDD